MTGTAAQPQVAADEGAGAPDIAERQAVEQALAESREQSERLRRMYETILGNSPDLAYVFDREHRFVYANGALLRMWGKTREEALGKTCFELGYEPWHAAMHGREIDQVIATRQPLRGDVPFNGAEGRRIYDYIFTPVIDDAGEVEFVVGNTRDVTERKEHEQKLAALAAELADADRRKTEFLAVLAHELRNPLAPIRNALQMMESPGDEAAHTGAIGIMRRQLAHMVRLVDDLMDVSRINRGSIELRRERVVLSTAIEQGVEACRPAIDAARQTVSLKLPAHAIHLDADPVRLAQVFGNLLSNASKYSPPDSAIDVEAATEGPMVRVTVRDRGVGIPPDLRLHVFEMFAQLNRPLDRSLGGLGIGLALVKSLVEMHGGTVSCESDGTERGSEFVVRLPTLEEVATRDALPNEAAPLSGHRVLVVDDNRDSAESLAMLLEMLGNRTKMAHDGQAAVDAVERDSPELVLLDIGLPVLDGYEACRRIRALDAGRGAVVIALTGWGQDDDRRRSSEAGFDAHLVKPVDLAQLTRLVGRLMAERSAQPAT